MDNQNTLPISAKNKLSRRDFLKLAGLTTAAALACRFPSLLPQEADPNAQGEQKMRVFTVQELLALQDNAEGAQNLLDLVSTKFYGEGAKFNEGDTIIEVPLPPQGENTSHILGFPGVPAGTIGKGKGKGESEGWQIQIQRRDITDPLAIMEDKKNPDLNTSPFVQRTVGGGNFIPLGDPLKDSGIVGYDSWIPLEFPDKSVKPGLAALFVSEHYAYFISPQKSILEPANIPLNLGAVGNATIKKADASFTK